ncbi:hypothetical protein MAR_009216 [Mya arenaria]|uniref:VWFC domain-containing protein n=1 Tax=Mya arenaria TaxID=6604 RepID=A0ABY7DY56_MYAAR|nr:hypothetical protein MAR_009216 [Mya arenaria]
MSVDEDKSLHLYQIERVGVVNGTVRNGCYYNGQFRHGNWTDGCDFKCKCENPETGHYVCHVRCPTYKNLPKGCTLKLPIGEECCQELDCSSTTTLVNTKGPNLQSDDFDTNASTPMEGLNTVMDLPIYTPESEYGCLYKGKYYTGQWNDSCDHTCVCEEPFSGRYTCHERCPAINEIPAICTVKAPIEDECCARIECNDTEIKSLSFTHSTIGTDLGEFSSQSFISRSNFTDSHSQGDKYPTSTLPTIDKVGEYKGVNINTVAFSKESNLQIPEISAVIPLKERDRLLALIFSKYGPVSLFTAKGVHDGTVRSDSISLDSLSPTGDELNDSAKAAAMQVHRDILQNMIAVDTIAKPIESETIAKPIEGDTIAKPIERDTISKPMESDTVAKSMESDTIAKPIESETIAKPIESETIAKPIEGDTISKPIERDTIAKPIERDTIAKPIERVTIAKPIESETIAKPIESETIAQPIEGDTIAKPIERDTIAKPIERDTIAKPIESETIAKPIEKPIGSVASKRLCQFNGYKYAEGEQWYDGCKRTCVCKNPVDNMYICEERCQQYRKLPPGCLFGKGPVDDCCTVPDCRHGNVFINRKTRNIAQLFSRFRQNGSSLKLTKELFNDRVRNQPQKKAGIIPLRENFFEGFKTRDDANKNKAKQTNSLKLSLQQVATESAKYAGSHLTNDKHKSQVFKTRLKSEITEMVDRSSTLDNTHVTTVNTTLRTIVPESSPSVVTKDYDVSRRSNTTVLSNGLCEFKTKFYAEGESWNDGCQTGCRCLPGGIPSCKSNCYHYRVIPRGCFLAAPNGCCDILICPNSHRFGRQAVGRTPLQQVAQPDQLNTWRQQFLQRTNSALRSQHVTGQRPFYRNGSNQKYRTNYRIESGHTLRSIYSPPRSFYLPFVKTSLNRHSRNIPSVHSTNTSSSNLTGNNSSGNTARSSQGNYVAAEKHYTPFRYVSSNLRPMTINFARWNRNSNIGNILGCVVGSKLYRQGETWNEKCKQKCTCDNEAEHHVTCRKLCPEWKLPAVCTLQQPSEGKCCPYPKCPQGFQLQQPLGYIPE